MNPRMGFVLGLLAGSTLLTAAPLRSAVTGHVRDEAGKAIPGAEVRVLLLGPDRTLSTITDSAGRFSLDVPPAPQISITASHSDVGVQWTSGVRIGSPTWDRYRYVGPMPTEPIELVLRKGVVLQGRAFDARGEPFARQEIFLVSPYIGSGPGRFLTSTDENGRFTFERAVLTTFELVPRALDQWSPATPGQYVRIEQRPETWLAAAEAGRSIEVRIDSYALVPVSVTVSALHATVVEIWKRLATGSSWGTTLSPDSSGRVTIAMEEGVLHELWVAPGVLNRSGPAPWTNGKAPDWTGTPIGRTEITVAAPAAR